MDGKSKGKYIPPALRRAMEDPSASTPPPPPTPPTESKFAKFLGSTSERGRIEATSKWGRRDGRSGYLDDRALGEEEALFSQNTSSGSGIEVYEDIPVEVTPEVTPLEDFSTLNTHPQLAKNLAKMNFSKPTPVQKYAIPVIQDGHSLMACAQTGSGKTGAYLIPIIAKMMQSGPPAASRSREARPVALLLAPTRELSQQIYTEARKFAHRTGIRSAVVYGGADPKDQSRALSQGCDILIATPGRLLDFTGRGRIDLSGTQYVVIDEGDRMLDMGFIPQVTSILEQTTNSQMVMCSATFPREIQAMASQFLGNYTFLTVGREGSTTGNIVQELHYLEEHEKRVFLHERMQKLKGLVLIFVETKRNTEALVDFLFRAGYSCTCIHGDRTQPERDRAISEFKQGLKPVLVATDVASRGLDISNVANVINYDAPNNIQEYVHRIGRTGRAGKQGLAITFLTEKNRPIVKDLYSLMCETNQELPDWLEGLYRDSLSQRRGSRRRW
jgi:ATP-dependent RNA helicase DDX3X